MATPENILIESCRYAILQAYDSNELRSVIGCQITALFEMLLEQEKPEYEHFFLTRAFITLKLCMRKPLASEQILQYRSIADSLHRARVTSASEILYLLAEVSQDLIDSPPPFSHCHFAITPLTCPHCGKEGKYPLWEVINTTIRPLLRDQAKKGKLTRSPDCHFCAEPIGLYAPFFYCDPARGEYLMYCPWCAPDTFNDFFDGCNKYLKELPPGFKNQAELVAYYEGIPGPWTGGSTECAMLFRMSSAEQFERILNEAIWNNSHPTPFIEMALIEGNSSAEFAKGNYADAAKGLINGFLKDQTQYQFLLSLAAVLEAINEFDLAKTLRSRTEALLLELRKFKICTDRRHGHPVSDPPILQDILLHGLPQTWGFGDLIEMVKKSLELFNKKA